MAVTGVLGSWRQRPAAGRWSVAAFVLAGIGVVAATWIIVASDGDPAGVLWPLVVAPVAIALMPVLLPWDGARLGAAIALGAWCLLTGLSIGFLLVPAVAAQIGAVVLEGGT
jgi:hypothetical protein